MPLTICPDCGREVSDRAPACIHCGCPLDSACPPSPAPAPATAAPPRYDFGSSDGFCRVCPRCDSVVPSSLDHCLACDGIVWAVPTIRYSEVPTTTPRTRNFLRSADQSYLECDACGAMNRVELGATCKACGAPLNGSPVPLPPHPLRVVQSAPASPGVSGMAILGGLFTVGGVGGLLFALNMSTSVEVEGSPFGVSQVNNVGLMNDKQNAIIIACCVLALGVILLAINAVRAKK